ncbi:MAG: Slp family lipoprotein [Dissulfurispiraceae bacterium]|jgi:outer membrane lipoprotein|nr:Slp family lipoprotein [Dissulfurispiraceae bacterium]
MKGLLIILMLMLASGCSHVISKDIRQTADPQPSHETLFGSPERFAGRVVIVGGIIASSSNTDEGTYIEVVSKPLTHTGRPEKTDATYGRFLILYPGFLETSSYSKNREITAAGTVNGIRKQKLGEIEYNYLFITAREIYLFEKDTDRYYPPVHFGIGIFKGF